ncbi:MAG TPA: hypothetical protein VG206_11605 [Terriglobia bacterium]|nr:hypothetical protein [Terriglobia bacterium]
MAIGVLLLTGLAAANPQEQSTAAASTASETVVPRLVSFTGTVLDPKGVPVTGPVSLTFSLYALQEGGSPLWVETQKLQLDEQGHYTVLLGATQPSGLPLDLFTSGEAQWLGVQPELAGFGEQPRVLLVGMPYALKAADADTLGGLPPSAFAMAPAGSSGALGTTPSASPQTEGSGASGVSNLLAPTITGSGTANTLAMFTGGSTIGNSLITQSGGAAVVSEALQMPALGTATSSAGFNSQPHDNLASAYNSSTKAAVSQHFRWQAEPVSNNTSTPSGKFNLLFGSGTATPAETGLSISSKGLLSFASGQTFPGTGSGTVTSVASGAGLMGGPITSSGSLSIASGGVTNAMLQNSSVTVSPGADMTGGGPVSLGGSVSLSLDTTKVPQLNAANTFTGNQTISGNLGVGTASPSTTLTVVGNNTYAPVWVQSSSTFGTWMQLANTSAGGHTWNILSAASGNSEGAGSLGITDLTGTSKIWLEGNVQSTSLNASASVSGASGSFTGNTTGQTLLATNAGTGAGVLGSSSNTSYGFGVEGTANPNTASTTGVYGTGGVGVWGLAPATSGELIGVAGETNSTAGYGVFAVGAADNTNYGIAGLGTITYGGYESGSAAYGGDGLHAYGGNGGGTPGSGGTGILAIAGSGSNSGFGGFGIYTEGGSSNPGQGGDGIYAVAGTGSVVGSNGYAGVFYGDIDVTGAIYAGTKDFKIDHPTDPANRYLYHASVESSEMMNIYTGNATLDSSGSATVQLPDWFEALNADFRYQLTCIGGFAPVYVSQKVQSHSFRIAGGQAGMEVSWQITGVRHDAYAAAHPLVAEVDKPADERGFYIHPELFGESEEKQVEWGRRPEFMKHLQEMRQKGSQRKALPNLSSTVR